MGHLKRGSGYSPQYNLGYPTVEDIVRRFASAQSLGLSGDFSGISYVRAADCYVSWTQNTIEHSGKTLDNRALVLRAISPHCVFICIPPPIAYPVIDYVRFTDSGRMVKETGASMEQKSRTKQARKAL